MKVLLKMAFHRQRLWKFSGQLWVPAPGCSVLSSTMQETALNLHTQVDEPLRVLRSSQFSRALQQRAGKQAGLLEKTSAFSSLMEICFPFTWHLFPCSVFSLCMYLFPISASCCASSCTASRVETPREHTMGHRLARRLLFCCFSSRFSKSKGTSGSLRIKVFFLPWIQGTSVKFCGSACLPGGNYSGNVSFLHRQ